MVLSALTTRASGNRRWSCSPRLSVFVIARLGGMPREKSSGLATLSRTFPFRFSEPPASSAASGFDDLEGPALRDSGAFRAGCLSTVIGESEIDAGRGRLRLVRSDGAGPEAAPTEDLAG